MKGVNKTGFNRKLGDAIERVGQKITGTGASKLGKKIYDAGDRLEHKDDVVNDQPIKGVK